MAVIAGGFDANDVEPNDREVIPAGLYLVQIISSEEQPNSKGTGTYIKIEFEILDGEYQGRHLWANLNLNNPNETAVRIAYQELSAICRAVGIMRPTDTTELHFKPMIANVKVRPAGLDKQGVARDAQNEMGGYKPAAGAAPTTAKATTSPRTSTAAPTKPTTPSAPTGAVTPPWKRMAAAA